MKKGEKMKKEKNEKEKKARTKTLNTAVVVEHSVTHDRQ